MKNITILSLVLIGLLFACKNAPIDNTSQEKISYPNTTTVEADLFFGFLRIGNFYNKTEPTKEQLEYALDTISIENLGEEKELIILYKKLKERDLLYTPYIDVKLQDGSQVTWYLTNSFDYDTIKNYSLSELKATSTKVHLTGEIEHIYKNAYLCEKIRKFEVLKALGYQNTDRQMNGKEYK